MATTEHPDRLGMLGRLLARVGGDELGARLAQGAALAFTVNVFGLLINLGSQIVLTRTLGGEGFGIYIYAFTLVQLLLVPAVLGLNVVQLRYVAAYLAGEEWALLHGLLSFTGRVLLVSGLLWCGAALLVAWQIQDQLGPTLTATFRVGVMLVPVLTLVRARTSVIRALGRVVVALAPDSIGRPLMLLVVVGALGLLSPGEVGPVTAMIVTLVSALLTLGILSTASARLIPAAVRTADPVQRPKLWLAMGFPLMLFEAVAVANNQTALLMLGWLGTTTDAGVFAVASRLAGLVAFPLTAVTLAFAPRIAALYSTNELAALQRMAAVTAWWTTTGALAVGLPLFLLPDFFLSLFGETFAERGSAALRILVLGQFVNALTGSVGAIMNMTGLERYSIFVLAVAAGLNVGLNIVLIPQFGLHGAAVAQATGVAIASLGAVIVLWYYRAIFSGIFASLRRSSGLSV